MIQPHSAQLGASAWAEKATFTPAPSDDPPSEPAKSARVRLGVPFPFAWPLAPLVAMTVSSSFATETGAAGAAAGAAEPFAWSSVEGAGASTGAGATTASDWAV